VIGLVSLAMLTGVVLAVTRITRDVPATVNVQLRPQDGIEIYLDEALTQPADNLDFGEVNADVFGFVVDGPAEVPVWVKNISLSTIRLSLDDDYDVADVVFVGEDQEPILAPDDVLAGVLVLEYHQPAEAGTRPFTVSVNADGPTPGKKPPVTHCGPPSPLPGAYVPGQVVVGFNEGVTKLEAASLIDGYGLTWEPNFSSMFAVWAKVLSGSPEDYISDLEASGLVRWAKHRGNPNGESGFNYIVVQFGGSATLETAQELINSFQGLEAANVVTPPNWAVVQVPDGSEGCWIAKFESEAIVKYAQVNYIIIVGPV